MKYTFKQLNKVDYNPFAIDSNTHLTQSPQYSTWQETLNKKVVYFSLSQDGKDIITAQYIFYPLIKGKSYLYAPYGPIIKTDTEKEAVLEFLKEVKKYASENNCVFVRSEIPEEYNISKPLSFISSSSYTQKRHEWFVDITKSEEEILTELDQKTRYKVRFAQKKLLQVLICDTDDEHACEIFLQLMNETSKRNKFRLHEDGYYKTILEDVAKEKNGKLVIIKKDDIPLAVNLLVYTGETVHFLFGGSSDLHKNLMASYLVHFESIKTAQSIGAKYYSFGALNGDKDFNTSLLGVTVFKKSWNGFYLNHHNIHDDVCDFFWYTIYALYKLLRKFI